MQADWKVTQFIQKKTKPDQQQQKEFVQTAMQRWQSKGVFTQQADTFFKELDNIESSQTNSVNNCILSTYFWMKSSSQIQDIDQ